MESNTNSNYFIHQSIFIVSGYTRTIVLDHERKDVFFIPNELGSILNSSMFLKLSDLEIIKDYGWLEYLEAKEVVTQLPNNQFQFRKLSTQFSSPSLISHVKLFGYTEMCFEPVIQNIENFGCKSLTIIFNNAQSKLISLFYRLDKILVESSLTFIQLTLFINDSREASILYNELISGAINFLRIRRVNFFVESEKQYFYVTNSNCKKLPIVEYRAFDSFNLNLQYFLESMKTNCFFNQLIEVCNNGKARIPSGTELFDLTFCRSKSEFIRWLDKNNKIWFSKKDSTDVCKDCEFRHMCVDNRLPHQRTENEWYHQTECNYNPYIAKWQGEEGYRNLAECGVISNENGFSIDHEKIAEINKELWEEDED